MPSDPWKIFMPLTEFDLAMLFVRVVFAEALTVIPSELFSAAQESTRVLAEPWTNIPVCVLPDEFTFETLIPYELIMFMPSWLDSVIFPPFIDELVEEETAMPKNPDLLIWFPPRIALFDPWRLMPYWLEFEIPLFVILVEFELEIRMPDAAFDIEFPVI